MPSYYIPNTFRIGEVAVLSTEETNHAVRVMRLKENDHLTLLNGQGVKADAVLLPAESPRRIREAACRVEALETFPQTHPAITLYVAPPRNKNMDLVLKAATELGVTDIVPIICQFAVSKPETDVPATWTQTLVAAMKQSGNPWLPALHTPVSFSQAIASSTATGFFGAVPREGETDTAFPSPVPEKLSLWIGPEGGFSEEEEQAMRAKGLRPLTVGPWILRVETAVTALLGAILLKSR